LVQGVLGWERGGGWATVAPSCASVVGGWSDWQAEQPRACTVLSTVTALKKRALLQIEERCLYDGQDIGTSWNQHVAFGVQTVIQSLCRTLGCDQ
jgi:hypothetical protein